ncbi:hypothetical protein ACJA88_014282 [Fusarium oxysporum]
MTIVNFYRQNDEKDALNTLLRWPVPERCLVAGDFNARHHSWQTGQATNRGQEIADWTSENDLNLLNTLDIPTNPHGNTIDLAFTNLPLAEATVEDHLATSSDHFTLSLTFPDIRWTPMQPAKIRVTTEDELKRFVEIVELGATKIPLTHSTPAELDELASALVNLLTSAAKASGRPARKGGRPAPWWTEECADAAATFRAIRRSYPLGFNQDVQMAKRDFHRVVRRAKRKYWRNLIDSFSCSSAVFKAVRWLKSPGAFQPPPLQVDNVVYETQIDKANALRQATLERRTAEDDIANPWTPVTPRRPIPTAPAVRHGDVEKHPESALRWLGIWLDSRLSFRLHVEKWAAKAKAVAYHLRGLTNTIHGPLPSAVRSAVRACVEPVLLHGLEAWTRLRRTDELLAPCERPKLVQRCFHQEQMPPLQMASKEKSTGAFLHWVERLDPLTLVVYSDGSLSSEGAASYGFTIHQNNVPIFDGSGRLGPAEAFDAEATGALEGLKAALNLQGLPTRADAPARSLTPLAGSEVPPRGLRRVSREVRPRRCAPGLLMRPTQSTGSYLLLQKGTAASSNEASTLTECNSQSSNRKRLYQVYRSV